jgi:hypothetical protein
MRWAGNRLSIFPSERRLAAREFLGPSIEANRLESNIAEWDGPIYFCSLTCDFFQWLLPFLFWRLLLLFPGEQNQKRVEIPF